MRLRWSLAQSRALAAELWPVFERFANGPAPPEDCPECAETWAWLRPALLRTFENKGGAALYPSGPYAADLPVVLELTRAGRWRARVDYTPRAQRPSGCKSLAPELAPLMLALLEHAAVRALVKACPRCGRLFMRARAARAWGRRAFCGTACRRAWQATPRGREENRRRQVAHRRGLPHRRIARTA